MTPDPTPPSPEALEEAEEIIVKLGLLFSVPEGGTNRSRVIHGIASALQEKSDECQRLRELLKELKYDVADVAEAAEKGLIHPDELRLNEKRRWERTVADLQAKLGEREKEVERLRISKEEAITWHVNEQRKAEARLSDAVGKLAESEGMVYHLKAEEKFYFEKSRTAEAETKRLREAVMRLQARVAHNIDCPAAQWGGKPVCTCGLYDTLDDINAALGGGGTP